MALRRDPIRLFTTHTQIPSPVADPLGWAVASFRDARAERYVTYQDYLDGNQPMEFATEKFRQAFGRLFHAFAYNRCQSVIDAHADRVRVAGIGANDPDLAQEAQALWDASQMDIHQGQLATESFGMGDAYLLVEVHPMTGDVQLWPQPARNVRVHYDEDRPGVVDLAAKLWRDEDKYTRLNLYFADRIEKYRSKTKTHHGVPSSAKLFEPYQPDGDTRWPVRLPLNDTVPVFPFPNNAPINGYGVSELRDVLGLQDALNKSLMDQMVAEEFTAYRQRVILNYDASDADSRRELDNLVTGITNILAVPPPVDGAPSPSLAEFSATDMKQYDLVAEKWDIRISRVTKVPVHYLTQTSIASSGTALRIAEAPFVQKITDRQLEKAVGYRNALSYGLRLQNVDVRPGDLRINWYPASPMSDEDVWALADQKRMAGMPFVAVLREAGYDPEQIETILQERRDDAEAAVRALTRDVRLPELDEGE